MGQCVFRDMGFDFEKDSQKQQVLTDFIKEKLAVKYPLTSNFQKAKSVTTREQSSKLKLKESTISLNGFFYLSF